MIGSADGARTLPLPPAPLMTRASGVTLALASMTRIQLDAALTEPLFDRSGRPASWRSGWRSLR
jgi:hypothetical protein